MVEVLLMLYGATVFVSADADEQQQCLHKYHSHLICCHLDKKDRMWLITVRQTTLWIRDQGLKRSTLGMRVTFELKTTQPSKPTLYHDDGLTSKTQVSRPHLSCTSL